MISGRARRSISTACSTTSDANALGTSRHPRRTRASHLAVLSRLERAAVGSGRRPRCCCRGRRAAPCPLDRDLHGRRREVPRAVLSALSSRRPVRQADGRQRLSRNHRQIHDREARNGAGDPRGDSRWRHRHLWRRQPVRRLLRSRSHGAEPVQGRRHPSPSGACGDRARHHDLHHVGVARHSCAAKCDPHALLRYHALRRARPRHYRRRHHARLWTVVAQPR